MQVCFGCGRPDHFIRDCPDRMVKARERDGEKETPGVSTRMPRREATALPLPRDSSPVTVPTPELVKRTSMAMMSAFPGMAAGMKLRGQVGSGGSKAATMRYDPYRPPAILPEAGRQDVKKDGLAAISFGPPPEPVTAEVKAQEPELTPGVGEDARREEVRNSPVVQEPELTSGVGEDARSGDVRKSPVVQEPEPTSQVTQTPREWEVGTEVWAWVIPPSPARRHAWVAGRITERKTAQFTVDFGTYTKSLQKSKWVHVRKRGQGDDTAPEPLREEEGGEDARGRGATPRRGAGRARSSPTKGTKAVRGDRDQAGGPEPKRHESEEAIRAVKADGAQAAPLLPQ